jgi:hypothetical protein
MPIMVVSWFLNMNFGRFVTLCVMGPKMDWLNYLHKGWLQRYQPKYFHSLKVT